MDFKIIDHKKIIEGTYGFHGKINITEFEKSKNFQKYKIDFIRQLRILLNKYSVNSVVRKEILGRYEQKSQLIQLRGKGCVLNYYWPNGELKSLALMDRYLITDQPYWLKYYPFIDIINKKDGDYVEINDQFCKNASIYELNKTKSSLITHNNHFGHFLFDDYPRLVLDDLQFKSYISNSKSPGNLSKGIEDILKNCLKIRITNISDQEGRNSVIKTSNLLTSIATNPIINSYVVMQLFRSYRKGLAKTKSENKKVYLERSMQYKSRVGNKEELKELLEKENFVRYDPSKYSTMELLEILNDASVIITEAGTSCLVSSLYAPPKCKVLALVPDDLIKNPDKEMIISGLPYHFTNPFNTEFILGKPTCEHKIQSSKQCVYSIEEIKDRVTELTKK